MGANACERGFCDNSTEVLISPYSRRSEGSNLPIRYYRVAACRPLTLIIGGQPAGFGEQTIEFPILGAGQECGDLRPRVEQGGTGREPRVAHRELAAGQRGQLDAGAIRVAVPALLPADVAEFGGEHADVGYDGVIPFRRVGGAPGLED